MSQAETANAIITVICSTFISGLFFAVAALVWNECRQRDELDRRFKREIRNAAHHAYTEAPRGRRDAA
jgi:hypothetical protein